MEYGLAVSWWLGFLVLFFLGGPLAARLLPATPDRGAGLALPIALLVVLLPTYWIGQTAFGWPTALVGVVILVAASALAGRGIDLPRREYSETALVFTLAFAFLIAVRAVDASAHPGGGEKFLDFGILQSLLRAHHLPPEDMWFAGRRLAYYYGGHLYAATLALLTNTPGRDAYNLALAGAYATEVTATFGLARDVAADRDYPQVAAGVIAAILLGLASNLFTPVRLLAGALPASWVSPVAAVLHVPMAKATTTPATFSYWTASRAMHRGSITYITEFPFFSYLNGDLHAHMLALIFSLLAVGVCYAYWRIPTEHRWRRRGLILGALPPSIGYVTLTNTWSLFWTSGVVFLTVALAPADPRSLLPRRLERALGGPAIDADVQDEHQTNHDARGRNNGDTVARLGNEGVRLLVGVVTAVAVGVLALAWVAPFVWNVLLVGVRNRHLAFLPQRSPLGGFLVVQGAFLFILGSYLAGKFDLSPRRALGVTGLVVAIGFTGWALNLVGLALAGPLVLIGWYLLRERAADVGFEMLLVVAGAGLLVIVEFVYFHGNAAPGRLNTVFKAYFVVWAFWSVAGGIALAGLLKRGQTWLPVRPDRRRVVSIVCVLLLLGVLVGPYAGLALRNHFEHGNPATLNAVAFTQRSHPKDAAAIQWLSRQPGQPTIVERPGRTVYAWRDPAASLTGVPDVIGWHHEAIYRGSHAFQVRARDVDIIYSTTHERTRNILLKKYDVRYVWDGPLERHKYGNVTMRLNADPVLSVAYHAGGVTVYAVQNATKNASSNARANAITRAETPL